MRNEYTTLCRSDLHTYAGRRSEKTPTILGHEIVGRIAAMGPEAPAHDCRDQPLRVGDRVTWAIYASDPNSLMAMAGIPQKAPGLFKYGHERCTADSGFHGGLSEYCLLRRNTPVARVLGDPPVEVVALVNCAIATAAGAVRLAGPVRDRNVLIGGAGMLGLATAALCRVAGARRLLAADVSASRLALARSFGIDSTLLVHPGCPLPAEQLPALGTPDSITVAIDCSGSPETMERLVQTLDVGGTLVLLGATYPQRPICVDAEQIVRRLLSIRGLHNYNLEDFKTALGFIEAWHARFPFLDLIEGGFDLDSVEGAFVRALESPSPRVGVCTKSARSSSDC